MKGPDIPPTYWPTSVFAFPKQKKGEEKLSDTLKTDGPGGQLCASDVWLFRDILGKQTIGDKNFNEEKLVRAVEVRSLKGNNGTLPLVIDYETRSRLSGVTITKTRKRKGENERRLFGLISFVCKDCSCERNHWKEILTPQRIEKLARKLTPIWQN